MIKKLFMVIFLMSLLGVLQSKDISVNIPDKNIAGNDFLMKVYLPSNCMSGISRLVFDFPNGFTIEGRNSHNSTFEFKNGEAIYQWMAFPENEEVELVINISTSSQMQGPKVIKGYASYLKSKEMLRINIEPVVTTILPSDSSRSKSSQDEFSLFTYKQFLAEGIACIRQVPYIKNDEIIVNILVSKGKLGTYGKIQEQIPKGYDVINTKSNNAMFIYNEKQRIVKYMWMNMPDKPQFLVSYKLVPNSDYDENQQFLIFGSFYYAENNSTKSVDVKQRGVKFNLDDL